MNFTSLVSLVEPRTKVASSLSFIFGSLYAYYTFNTFNSFRAVIMFCSMFLFDMAITAINYYIDYKKNIFQKDYIYEISNPIFRYNINTRLVKLIILFMLTIATLLSLYLAYLTSAIVSLIIIIYFIIGICYTCGPIPISYTPLGEFFCGITIGLALTFISIYIHIFDNRIFNLQFDTNQFLVYFDLNAFLGVVLVCMPFVIIISNMILANNLCNLTEDFQNKRFTLPICIGKENALLIWEFSYYLIYVFILIAVLLKYLPLFCLISLISFFPVKHHIEYFKLKQIKSETLCCAIHNFLIIGLSLIGTLGLELFVKHFLF